jgi:hypothetical protein
VIKLVRYESWHYEYLAGQTGADLVMTPETVKLFAEMYLHRGTSLTAKFEGRIIGCAGVVNLWTGVGEAWTMLGPEVKANPYFLHRKVKWIMRGIIKDKELHRLQAIVSLNDEPALQWIHSLGFEFEGRMRKFNPDKTDSGMFTYPLE